MNVGELIKEYEALGEALDKWEDPRPVMRAKRASLRKLIAIYDPLKDLPPDEVTEKPSKRKGRNGTHACIIPGCEEKTMTERCVTHAARWQKSEESKDQPGAVKCEYCTDEVGPWVKSKVGLSMHLRKAHPGKHLEAVA
jgi:hypothetical protein